MPDRRPPRIVLCEAPLARLHQAIGGGQALRWGHVPLGSQEVLDAWKQGLLETASHSQTPNGWTRTRHLRRVAFFCAQGWQEPPRLAAEASGLVFLDGQHRFLAAQALRHRVVTVEVHGDRRHVERWLGRPEEPVEPFFPMPTAWGGRTLPLPATFR